MMLSGALAAGVAVAGLAGVIVWANPRRRTNQFVAICSLNVAAWLICLHFLFSVEEGLMWLRCTTAVGAFIPLSLWLVKESISSPSSEKLAALLRRGIGWVAISVAMAVLSFSEWFIPSYSTSASRVYGPGYYIYIGLFLFSCLLLLQRTYSRLSRLNGLAKLELQVWMLGGCAACVCVSILMAIRAVVQVPLNFQAVVVLTFYTVTTLAITTHRIFDARHIVLIALEKVSLLAVTAAAAFVVWSIGGLIFPDSLSFILTVAVTLWVAGILRGKLDAWFFHYPKAEHARQAAFAAAKNKLRSEDLSRSFRQVLNGWGQTDNSIILTGDGGGLEGCGLSLSAESPGVLSLQELAWATPERLLRERETPQRRCLADFMAGHNLGALVYLRGPTLSVVLGVGVRPSRRPFTFPEVTQLQELSSIFESALSRTHLLAKAQRAEQLATVGLIGAGVAHEIRNPLVSIKAFTQLLPHHYDDPEFRRRFSKLIGEEVDRIDRLTEQLLDLATPRSYQQQEIDLHAVISAALELVSARAEQREVEIITELQAKPSIVLADAGALKQVILNLCFNGLQAQDDSPRRRWVRIETSRHSDNTLQLVVSDNGPGIPQERRAQLFEPFQSTKSTGFGLGLTVCSEILSSLNSTISLDPPEPDRGATFRVHLPCPLPSS